MRVLVVLFAVGIAVAYASECVHHDPTTCSVTCPAGEAKACEHGVCTCATTSGTSCTLASDCPPCPPHDPHGPHGHMPHEEPHCLDGACACLPH